LKNDIVIEVTTFNYLTVQKTNGDKLTLLLLLYPKGCNTLLPEKLCAQLLQVTSRTVGLQQGVSSVSCTAMAYQQ